MGGRWRKGLISVFVFNWAPTLSSVIAGPLSPWFLLSLDTRWPVNNKKGWEQPSSSSLSPLSFPLYLPKWWSESFLEEGQRTRDGDMVSPLRDVSLISLPAVVRYNIYIMQKCTYVCMRRRWREKMCCCCHPPLFFFFKESQHSSI